MIPDSVLREINKYAKLALKRSGYIIESSRDDTYAFAARVPYMDRSKPVYLLIHEPVFRYYKFLRDAANYLPKNVILIDVEVYEDNSFKTVVYLTPKMAFCCEE